MAYELITASGRTVGTINGYPEAVLTARALAHAEPVAIAGFTEPRTVAEWDAHVEALRDLVGVR